MTETLFAQPKRRKGASEALLDKQLRAWHVDGVMAGDSWTSDRGLLRDAARAVDQAREDMRNGEGTAYSFARTVKIYHDLLAFYRSGQEVISGDSIDALIASLGAPTLRDET